MSWPISRDLPDRSRLHRFSWGRLWVGDYGPDASERDVLVVLHGLFTTCYDFRRILEVARDRRVLVVDLPGCGNSDRPLRPTCEDYSIAWLARCVHDLVEALGLRTIEILGHDFGGTVAVHVCQRLSARVSRAFLLAPLCFPVDPLALVPRPLPGLRKAVGATGVSGVFRRLFRRADLRDYLRRSMARPELLDPDAFDVYWDRLSRDGGLEASEAMLQQVEALRELPEAFRRIETPTTVVWGEDDRIVPLSHGDRLVATMHRATLVALPECGHAPHRERPRSIVGLL